MCALSFYRLVRMNATTTYAFWRALDAFQSIHQVRPANSLQVHLQERSLMFVKMMTAFDGRPSMRHACFPVAICWT